MVYVHYCGLLEQDPGGKRSVFTMLPSTTCKLKTFFLTTFLNISLHKLFSRCACSWLRYSQVWRPSWHTCWPASCTVQGQVYIANYTKLCKNALKLGRWSNCFKFLKRGDDAHYKMDHRRQRALFPFMIQHNIQHGYLLKDYAQLAWLP